ncbi:hypothetical protein Hanom_Chr08g00719891 [Helianthus anomalus]
MVLVPIAWGCNTMLTQTFCIFYSFQPTSQITNKYILSVEHIQSKREYLYDEL